MTKSETKIRNIINSLSSTEKDFMYRLLWSEYVAEDVKSYAEQENFSLTDEQVDTVVHRYVFEGEYDCENSYWEDLRAIIVDVLKKETH